MKIQDLKSQNEAIGDVIGGVKKFFRKLPGSAEKTERKFTDQIITSLTKSLQRAEDFNLLSTSPMPMAQQTQTSAAPATATPATATPANVTPAPQQAQTQPSSSAPVPQPKPTVSTSQPITFGGRKYIQTAKGWVDVQSNKLADANTVKILNQAAAKANQTPQPNAARQPSSITTGPNNKLAVKGLQMRENDNFNHLNYVFESIIQLQEGNIPVSDFIVNRWFVPWAKNQQVDFLNQEVLNQVKAIAKEIEKTYKVDKGINAVKKLADYLTNAYYDTLNQTGQSDSQTAIQPSVQPTQPSTDQAGLGTANMSDWARRRYGTGSQANINPNTIEAFFDNLYRINPNEVNKIIKKLISKYRVV